MCIVLVLVFVFFTEIGLINIPQVFQKFESQVFLRLTRKQSYKKRFKIYYKSQVLFVKLYFLFNRFRIFTTHLVRKNGNINNHHTVTHRYIWRSIHEY